jgi:nicotinate phosphoribosyltransferase
VETEHNGRVDYKSKFSEEKVYSPGRKQVFRFSVDSQYHHDLIARWNEKPPGGSPLLHPVMRDGQRLKPRPQLQESRINALANLDLLPEPYHALQDAPVYPVAKSEALERLLKEVHEQIFGAREGSRQ